jgi:hypothetical protein
MANQPIPNDPYGAPDDPRADEDVRRAFRLDNEMQPDPELTEGRASGAKVTMLAIAVAVVLGAVFYGLNNTPVHQAGTSPTATTSTAQNAAADRLPAAPPGMRDVTPRSNGQPGVTTGAAPASPAKPTNPEAPPATATPGAPNSATK